MRRKGSFRAIGTHGIRHGDSTSAVHLRDVREQAARKTVEFIPVSIPEEEIENKFCAKPLEVYAKGGWMGVFGSPLDNDLAGVNRVAPPAFVRKENPKDVTDYLETINRDRKQIRKAVRRDGKWRVETQRIHRVRTNEVDGNGKLRRDERGKPLTKEADPVTAISVDMPPWASEVFRQRLSNFDIDEMYVEFMQLAAAEINTTSGCQTLGASRHPDSQVDHCDLYFSCVLSDRTYIRAENYPSTGRWACRADRLDRAGLELFGQKTAWLEKAMERQNAGLDLRLFRLMDEVVDKHAAKHGLQAAIERKKEDYREWRKTAVAAHLLSKSLRHCGQYFLASGVKILEDAWHAKAITMVMAGAGVGLVAKAAIDKARQKISAAQEEEQIRAEQIDEANRMMDDPTMPPPRPRR